MTGEACSEPQWRTVEDLSEVCPTDLLALVIDMARSKGHVRFVDEEENETGAVGKDSNSKGYVIVEWQTGQTYMTFNGSCRIGHIYRDATTTASSS